MSSKAEKIIKRLEIKDVLVVGAAGAVIYYLYQLTKKPEEEKYNPCGVLLIRTKDGSTESSSITKAQAETIANNVYEAMNRIGTDWDRIKKNLIGLNGKSLQKVYCAFGKRRYFVTGRGSILGEKMDLTGWLIAELKSYQLNELKPVYDRANMVLK